jgi:4-hydroxy-tetrahydrodipicolinate reductase
MRDGPYRVIVWGPGVLGTVLMREILAKPELELVGVLAYSPEKNGIDVGEYLGMPPIGIKITTDKEAIFPLEADVVLHCPSITAPVDIDSEVTAEVCRLLESGKNVICSAAYHYPIFHGHELVDRLNAACQKGRSTMHSSGFNPGVLCERLVVALTAVCTRVDRIVVKETGDLSTLDSPNIMLALGFGQDPQDAAAAMELMDLGDRYCGEIVTHACNALGFEVERIEKECELLIADEDYSLKAVEVPKGTVGGFILKFTGIVAGKPFFTIEEIWYGDRSLCPITVTSSDYYLITIEGAPTSLRITMDVMASVVENRRFHPGDDTMPSYFASAPPILQAVPLVCDAGPGILYPSVFANCVPDLRILADRRRGSLPWEISDSRTLVGSSTES